MRLAISRLCREQGTLQLAEEEIDEALELMDRDGSGTLNYEQFVEWWSVWQYRQTHAPDDPVIGFYREYDLHAHY
jgi:hypothetical protein